MASNVVSQPISASQSASGGTHCQQITDLQTLQTAYQQLEKQKVEMLAAFSVIYEMAFKKGTFWGIQKAGVWVGLARTQVIGDELHLDQISTVPKCGYGPILINYLVYQAKAKSLKKITLKSANASLDGFYKKCGFTQVGDKREFFYNLADAGMGSVATHQKNNEMEKARYQQGEAFPQFPHKVAEIIGEYLGV